MPRHSPVRNQALHDRDGATCLTHENDRRKDEQGHRDRAGQDGHVLDGWIRTGLVRRCERRAEKGNGAGRSATRRLLAPVIMTEVASRRKG